MTLALERREPLDPLVTTEQREKEAFLVFPAPMGFRACPEPKASQE